MKNTLSWAKSYPLDMVCIHVYLWNTFPRDVTTVDGEPGMEMICLGLREEIFSLDVEAFWRENETLMGRFDATKKRVPVSIGLGEDFIKGEMGVEDHRRFYLDFEYQQSIRLECGKRTREVLGLDIGPGINFGTTTESIFGGEVVHPPNAPPWIKPVATDLDEAKALLEHLPHIDVMNAGETPRWLEWRERIKREYGVDIKGGLGCHGGVELGVLAFGATNLCLWLVEEPAFMKEMLLELGRTVVRWMKAVRRVTGAPERGLWIGNDSATLVSRAMYEEFSFPVEKMIYEAFSPEPSDLRFYHADSEMTHLLEPLRELGVTDVNLGPTVDPREIRKKIPNAVIHGQVPPLLLRNGSIEDVVNAARRDIEWVGRDGGLVLTTAGSINEGTPMENILALMYAAASSELR